MLSGLALELGAGRLSSAQMLKPQVSEAVLKKAERCSLGSEDLRAETSLGGLWLSLVFAEVSQCVSAKLIPIPRPS